MPNPEHYLSDSAWACLSDPHVQLTTKIHLLAALMIALKMEKPLENMFVVHRVLDRSAGIT